MSLLDQFEVQFNELSNGEIVDGELSELQAFRVQLSKLERGQQPAEGSQGRQCSQEHFVKSIFG